MYERVEINSYYKVVFVKNTISITTYNFADINDTLIIEVYDKKDSSRISPVYKNSITANSSLAVTLNDGLYIVVLKYVDNVTEAITTENHFINEYDFNVTQELFNYVVDKLASYICRCDTCLDKLFSRCDDCKEDSDCKNNFIFFNSLIAFFNVIQNYYSLDDLQLLLRNYLKKYEGTVYNDILNSFYKSFVKGDYELMFDLNYHILAVIYTVMLMNNYSDNLMFNSQALFDDLIDSVFNYSEVIECLYNHSVYFDDIMFEYRNIEKGYIDLISITGDEKELYDIFIELLNTNKINTTYNDIQDITVNEDLSKQGGLIIIVPKVWGRIDKITVNGTDITSGINMYDFGKYLVYYDTTVYTTSVEVKINFKY